MDEASLEQNSTFYRMARSHDGSARLTLQHYLWREQFGWSLHPTIAADWQARNSGQEVKIADVACGNAIWGFEQAVKHYPGVKVRVTGFDISKAQIPPQSTWPSNFKFALWNVYDTPANEYVGQFDVVHIRLILAAIPDGNPLPILGNLLSLLKPGGFLQWCETDIHNKQVTRCEYGLQIADEIMSRYGRQTSVEWVPQLSQILEKNGLVNVSKIHELPQPWMYRVWWDNWMQGCRELVKGTNSPELDQIFYGLVEDLQKNDDTLIFKNIIAIGQKPFANET